MTLLTVRIISGRATLSTCPVVDFNPIIIEVRSKKLLPELDVTYNDWAVFRFHL